MEIYNEGRCVFICNALAKVFRVNKNLKPDKSLRCYSLARDYINEAMEKTNAWYYSGHLAQLGVPLKLVNNLEWMQLRRRELLCQMISHFESIGD